MVDAGTHAIRRLRKIEAERLLADYDADPIAALSAALRVILEMPEAEWAELVTAAPIDAERRRLLLEGKQPTLDRFAAELNERRGFETQ